MNAKKSLVLDGLLAVAFVASLVPNLTTVAGHEWLGLVVTLAFIVHFAAHLRLLPDRNGLRVANLCVDGIALVVLATCAVSGLLVSGAVLPAFGLYAEGYFFWDPLHATAAKVLLALVVVHLALHVRFMTGALRPGSGLSRKRVQTSGNTQGSEPARWHVERGDRS